jgi:feruloyl esterase
MVTSLSLSDTTIVSSKLQPAGAFVPPDGTATITNLPSFCRVVLKIAPAINIEVWLPAENWNGRFQGVGNGGLAGSISYTELATAILANYASASTDGGHLASDPQFLADDQQVIDLGSRAVHLMTVQSKAIMQSYYATAPSYSYFNGCSTGGGQGMMESQRYPDDYNGIVVGAPQWHRTHLASTHAWNWNAAHITPASNLPTATLNLIGNAVLTKCDALDGVKDGVIENPAICSWSPTELACTAGQDPSTCLSPDQVTAVQKLYAGPKDPVTGAEVFPGYATGVEFGWTNEVGATPFAAAFNVIVYGLENGNRNYNFLTFNFHSDVAALDAKFSDAWTAGNPDIQEFTKRGGKMLVYQGYADWGITYLDTLEYYNSLITAYTAAGQTAADGQAAVNNFWRMFFVPGMGHCSGGALGDSFNTQSALNLLQASGATSQGPGTDTFDPMPSLVNWVENKNPPTSIVASHLTGGIVDKTRPLCQYPNVAVYNGSGDINQASSFSCGVQPAVAN